MRSSGRNTGGRRDDRRDDRRAGKKPYGDKRGQSRGQSQGQGAKRTGRPRPEERRYGERPGGRPQGGGSEGSRPQGGRPQGARPQGGGPRGGQGSGQPASRGQGSGKGRGQVPGQGRDSGQSRGPGQGRGPGKGGTGQNGGQGRPAGARAGKPAPKSANGRPAKASSRKRTAPARSREYEAQIEERNRARQTGTRVKTPKTFGEQEGERLQKVLARAGMGSRRACEELVDRRRVEVNGRVVTEQGLRVDAGKDEIKVDGLTIAAQSYLFFALNKPAGVVASMEDPDGRQCLGDYVQNRETRLFHVGRLDTETEGIILLTNHGELAHRLTHPRYGVKKTYLAAVQGPIPRDLGKRLKEGVRLDDGYARADHFKIVENTGNNYLVEVSLHEGRKHIVRRMLAETGFPVEKLVRTRFGPIALGDQKSGWLRRLTNTEVGMLMDEVGL